MALTKDDIQNIIGNSKKLLKIFAEYPVNGVGKHSYWNVAS